MASRVAAQPPAISGLGGHRVVPPQRHPGPRRLDRDLLERALARLPLDERLAVAAVIEPKSAVQRRRLDARDGLIKQALADATGASLTARACALERRLKRAARGHAIIDELAEQILAYNENRGLGWQHLAKIARSGRNPELCKNSDGTAQTAWAGSSDEPA